MAAFLQLLKVLGPKLQLALPLILEILALFSSKTSAGLKAAAGESTDPIIVACVEECEKNGGDVATCQACCAVIAEAE